MDCVMNEHYIFRKATREEVPGVFAMILKRMAWMDGVGIRQWNITKYDARYPLWYYEERQREGELFILTDRETGELLCVGGLLRADERWPDTATASAYYLHHFASAPEHKGAGSVFIAMAEQYTAGQGIAYMRLDSAIGNEKLERYYGSRGYAPAGECKDGVYEGILRQKKLG